MKYITLITLFLVQPVLAYDSIEELYPVKVTSQPPTNTEHRIIGGYQTIKTNPNLNRNFTDALSTDVEVSNQSTGPQQSSPYIRGFTGYYNLMIIDGVRMNNSIFRSGPNQYWSTIDTYDVSSVDLYYGQSSMIYGSDAIGAALNVQSCKRTDYSNDGFNWNGRTAYRFASAENSNMGRMEVEGNYGKIVGFLIGGSIKGYGNMVGGELTGPQPNTGFDEQDMDARMDWNLTDKTLLTFFHQQFDSENAWRNHRTISATHANSVIGASPGTYNYDIYNQSRNLNYVNLNTTETPWFDELTITGSYQETGQYNTYQNSTPKQHKNDPIFQQFDVKTIGLDIQAKNHTNLGNFTYGIDYYHDFVKASGYRVQSNQILYGLPPVADNSSYDTYGMYVNDDIPLLNDRVILSLTSRYNLVRAQTGSIYNFDGKKNQIVALSNGINTSWDEFTNGGRVTIMLDPDKHYNWFIGANQGWRAPTIYDLSSNAPSLDGAINNPNPVLSPEKFVTYETGIGYSDKITNATLTFFRTNLTNMFSLSNSINPSNQNYGYIQGLAFKGEYNILDNLKTFMGASWTEGYTYGPNSNNVIVKDNMSKINPPQGIVGLHCDINQQTFVEGSARFVGAQDKLNINDIGDSTRIPTTGQSTYTLYGIRAGYTPIKNVTITGAIDNLNNVDYRVIGSGVNGLGRNFIASIDYRF